MVALGAQLKVGAVLSVTEMVRLQVEELPQSSVAVQVRVTEYSAAQAPGVVTSDDVGTTLGSHRSEAVAEPKLGVLGHSTSDTEGQVIEGAVLSVTEMVRLQVEELPQSSVAVQVRVTEYSAGQVPGVVTSDDVGTTLGSHRSEAVAAPKLGEAGHSTLDTVGQVIEGAVLSVTEIVRLQVEELPQSSVAVHVRVTENSAGQAPGVVTVENVGTTLGSQRSEAVAEPKLGELGHSTLDTVGQVIEGAVLSVTDMVRLQVEELPQSSVAVQVRVTENSAGHEPGVVTVEKVGTTLGSHRSEAVAEPKLGELGHSTEAAGFGQVIEGAVLSVTEIVRLQVEELPQSSVAVQVRVTEYSAGHEPGVVTSDDVGTTLGSHRSEAVAAPKFGVLGHSTEAPGFGHVIEGAVLSVTEIVRLQVEELPQSSVAVQVRVTEYSAGHEPGVVTSDDVGTTLGSHRSEAVAAPKLGVLGHSTFDTEGQVIEGAVLSVTEIVRLQVEELPQSSVAVQVRVTEYSAGHEPGVVTSDDVGTTLGSHRSEAVAAPKLGVLGHSTLDTEGHVIEGAVLSVTEMVRLQVDVLPQSSVAVQVRVTEYSAGHEPGVVTLLDVISTLTSHRSEAVAAPKLGVFGHSTLDTEGHVIEGGVLSVTEMVRLQVAELPQSSVAVQVRVTVNGQLPEVVTSAKVGTTLGSHRSEAVAAPKTIGFGHSTFDTVGQVIEGGVLSVTEIVRLQVEELPQSSVAVQVRVTEYSAGHEPGVVTSDDVGTTLGSHRSEAVAEPKLGVLGHSTEAPGFGQVIEGAVLSVTDMVRLQVEELPQSSVAVQVRVTEYSAGHEPGVVTSDDVGTTLGSHRSEAVAAPKLGEAGHSTLDTVGHVIEGAVLSDTEMVRLQVEELPQSSVAVQVRVTEYSAAQAPGVVTSDDVGTTSLSQRSEAVAAPKLGVLGHSTLDTEGHVIEGAVLSVTETVRLQLDVLLQLSVAVQVRVTEYSAAQAPGVVTSSAVMPTWVSQLSVADAKPKLGVLGHSTEVVGLGHVITGGTWSTTFTTLQQTTWPSSQVIVSQIENWLPQKLPAKTLIDEPVVEPTMVPAPVIDQW
jgi:hypothetical protein